LETENTNKADVIASQRSEIATYKPKAGYFNEICSFYARENIGYASSNFKMSESVVFLSKSDESKRINLYWSYVGRGQVNYNYSSWSIADLSFDGERWNNNSMGVIIFIGLTESQAANSNSA
jgi:hypothetical protein